MRIAALGVVLILAAVPSWASDLGKPKDPVAALVGLDPVGRQWLAVKKKASSGAMKTEDRLRLLTPWAQRYHVPIPSQLLPLGGGMRGQRDERVTLGAVSALEETINDALRRSVAAQRWKPMGETASWEAFLARQGFRLSDEQPSRYIVGVRNRVYRRAPKHPQAIHTCLLTTREDRSSTVFSITLQYTYPPKVAKRIHELEGTASDYEGALALRLPAFRADRPLLVSLGEQALSGDWPAYQEKWNLFIRYITDPAFLASRARVMASKNPPTVSEVRGFGGLIANLYDIGPDGRLEVSPLFNPLDLRGNPLYGVRPGVR